MNTTSTKGALCGLAAILLAAWGAQAQSAPPAAAPVMPAAPVVPAAASPSAPALPSSPPAPSQGPLVPAVCLLSQESLITRSKIGQAATARLRELAGQIQSNLNAEKARLEARGKALGDKRATLTPMELQAQSQALNQRAQALQETASQRSQQLDATKTHAFSRVIQQAQPFVAQAYAAHGCGLLFNREAVLSGNLGNDLTNEVLAALDAKGTPINFDLEPPATKSSR